MRVQALMFVVAVAGVIACEEDTTEPATVTYTASLSPANERPTAVTGSNGTGTFSGILDASTNIMTYTVTWSGLTTTSNNAHIHGPTDAGSNAPANVVIDFNDPANGRNITHGISGSATGTINLSTSGTTANPQINGDSLKKLFDAGRVYVNVHSTQNGGGEIAGNITRQ